VTGILFTMKDMFDRTLHFDKVKDFSVMVEEEARDMP
jgi:hypothetical protein